MSKLVEELMRDHVLIAETLEKVKNLGITSEAGQKTLLDAKNGLLAHLQKEDTYLYPALKKAAKNDESLKRTLNRFAKDMDSISTVALNFFSKYESGGSGLEFARDFGKLFIALSQRIGREENVLYEKYNELQ